MLSQYLKEFYHSWTEKANQITGDDLTHVYDKFITLFITYNNLYNQVTQELINKGTSLPNRIYDNKAATDYVVKYLGANNIINDNQKEINELIDIIDQELFYIKLKHGIRQRGEDIKLMDKLRSNNLNEKAIATLQVLYYVRCNMFHGHKQFVEYQRLLIEPLINILLVINKKIFLELNK